MGGHHAPGWQPLNRHDAPTFRAPSIYDQSASADEVENMLGGPRQVNRQFMPRPVNNAAQYNGRMMSMQSGQLLTDRRTPAIVFFS